MEKDELEAVEVTSVDRTYAERLRDFLAKELTVWGADLKIVDTDNGWTIKNSDERDHSSIHIARESGSVTINSGSMQFAMQLDEVVNRFKENPSNPLSKEDLTPKQALAHLAFSSAFRQVTKE